jgi:hypothetical protein
MDPIDEDGTCAETTGAMIDGFWKLEGDHFSITMTSDDKGKDLTQRGTSTIAGDTQEQIVDGHTRRLTRNTPAVPRNLMVGVWTYPHPAGGTAYEEYKADGRFLFRLPIGSTACRWRVDGERIRITVGAKTEDAKWRVSGDRLTIEGSKGAETFHRETAGIIKPR